MNAYRKALEAVQIAAMMVLYLGIMAAAVIFA